MTPYEQCGYLTIPSIIINGIFTLIISSIATVSLYHMVKSHLNKTTDSTISKQIFRQQTLFYVTCIVYAISRLPDIITWCYYHESPINTITHIASTVCYGIHWTIYLVILYLRLYHVFKDSVLEISKCMNKLVLFIIISSVPYGAFIVIGFIRIGFETGLLLYLFYLIGLLVFSQCLAFAFIHKLYKLNQYERNNNDIFVNTTRSNANERNDLTEIMTKYTVLALISIIGTTMIVIVYVIGSISGDAESPEIYLLSIVGQMLDVFIDVVCVSLSMKFYKSYYQRICKRIDIKCKDCCANMVNKHDIDLVDVNSNSTKINLSSKSNSK